MSNDNDLFVRTMDQITVRALLKQLDDKERDVICRRYGLTQDSEADGGGLSLFDEGETLESLAKEYNVSRERIRQIEREALRKMRRALSHKPR